MDKASINGIDSSAPTEKDTELPTDFELWRRDDGCLTKPLPSRLLLRHRHKSLQEGRQSARTAASADVLLAFFLVAMLCGALSKIGFFSPTFASGAFCLSLSGIAVRSYVKARASTDGRPWEVHEWIDFERRLWFSRKTEPEGSKTLQVTCFPLDRLALVCYVHMWEQGDSYEVCLSELTRIGERAGLVGPPRLNGLLSFSTKSESFRVAQALAQRWGITCWHRSDAR